MGKIFSFLGGRRQMSVFLTGLVALASESFLEPEAAARVTEAVLWIAGIFVGGESLADAAGRYKNGE